MIALNGVRSSWLILARKSDLALEAAAGRTGAARRTDGAGVRADQVGGLLADHDRGRVGVAGGDRGQERGVADAQPADSASPQPRVTYRRVVGAHAGGAPWLQVGD